MPTHIIPWRNTPHRIAAIALYRALLSQSRKLPLAAPEQRDAIQNVIRNRFKQSQRAQSPRLLKIEFEAGYEAVDYLDAAVAGDHQSQAYILDLLGRSPARVKEPKYARTVSRKNAVMGMDALEASTKVEKPQANLFDRPLPLDQLTGKRHVPILFNANHIPVLRLKKPQPASLSRYIRQRIEQRQKWHDCRHRLTSELSIAKLEDKWDRLVSRDRSGPEHAMVGTESDGGTTWTSIVREALLEVEAKLDAEGEKYRVMAAKMQAVVDREQELFDREKAERHAARSLERVGGEQRHLNEHDDRISRSAPAN